MFRGVSLVGFGVEGLDCCRLWGGGFKGLGG